jgi:2-polyprenyl-3-methyl-5-hydroxy-6-metoxy-1,4-benzoquinol methylase
LPLNRGAAILEIGCGEGGTGDLALSEGKCGRYCAIEFCAPAAETAARKLTEVLVGDIEKLDLPWRPETFDGLILSEVLEHLTDPWAVLRKIRPLMREGALVFASSPNVSHHSVIRMLIHGDWSLSDYGLMDRTHLRWYTPVTYRALFESCGYMVTSISELSTFTRKARAILAITGGRFKHLFMTQIDLRAHC